MSYDNNKSFIKLNGFPLKSISYKLDCLILSCLGFQNPGRDSLVSELQVLLPTDLGRRLCLVGIGVLYFVLFWVFTLNSCQAALTRMHHVGALSMLQMFELLHLCEYLFTVYMHCNCIGFIRWDDIIRYQISVYTDFSPRDVLCTL